MKSRAWTSAILLALMSSVFAADDGHEYSPLVEKVIQYKNWRLKDIKAGGELVELRSLLKDKKLVLIVYFAPWCGNCQFEAPVVARLYEKYKDKGFEVIGVSEYASLEETRAFFGKSGSPYKVVAESESGKDRQTTAHFQYRKTTGDTRNYGVPWNIFLQPDKLAKEGEVLTEKTWVVNGELIEAEVDQFIAKCLNESAPGKK